MRDTAASLTFYRDVLGLTVVGESENYGTEQEHLNNVFGVRLRITTLRAAAGPALEFLEYLAPRDGRPFPADARANDLLHWQTTLTVRDLEATAHQLRTGMFTWCLRHCHPLRQSSSALPQVSWSVTQTVMSCSSSHQ